MRALIHNMARDSEQLSDMRAAFQQLDTDSDGRVTYSEVRQLASSPSCSMSAHTTHCGARARGTAAAQPASRRASS